MIMMISKLCFNQKKLGGKKSVGKLGVLGATMLWGVYWGVMGPPEMGGSLGSMMSEDHRLSIV